MIAVTAMSQQETITLLNKCWMTHDAMWFYHCLHQCGIKLTNQLNKSAIKSMSHIEVKRIKRIMGMEKEIRSFDDFKSFFNCAARYLIPDFMNGSFDFGEKNTMAWRFVDNECFAFKGITGLGVIDEYECGVMHRIRSWIEAIGVDYRFNPDFKLCIMHHNGSCSGDIYLNFEK